MSLQDLQWAIARHLQSNLPGHETERYLRAAVAVSAPWREKK